MCPGQHGERGTGAQDGGMTLLDWDHNAYYHRLLMQQLPREAAPRTAEFRGSGRA
jgi:hypothetical protein